MQFSEKNRLFSIFMVTPLEFLYYCLQSFVIKIRKMRNIVYISQGRYGFYHRARHLEQNGSHKYLVRYSLRNSPPYMTATEGLGLLS